MAGGPYRKLAQVGPEPEPYVGSLQSIHRPPSLRRVLGGALLTGSVVFAEGVLLFGAGWGTMVLVALGVCGVLSWWPIRTQGPSVAVHSEGLVLSRQRRSAVISFESVSEVWFDIPRFLAGPAKYLRALVLVDETGKAHRVPLVGDGAATIVEAVTQHCSDPLLREAREAMAEGQTLTFGPAKLDAAGIAVGGKRASWSELGEVVIEPGRVLLFRRSPILAWRSMRLDRVPHPSVFLTLLAAKVGPPSVDPRLPVPLRATVVARQRRALPMLLGGILLVLGLELTTTTHLGLTVVGGALMAFGVYQLAQGFLLRRR